MGNIQAKTLYGVEGGILYGVASLVGSIRLQVSFAKET